ncbi:hypothetical protein Tco_1390058, partial [Tanacetum coccineum]
AESVNPSTAQLSAKPAPAGSIWQSSHLSRSQPADPAPLEHQLAPIRPRPEPSRKS